MLSLLLGLALMGGSPSAVSYVRVLTPEARADFYRTGGASYRGARVHLHVEGKLLHKKRGEYRTRDGAVYHRYENRTVPLIVAPRNRLYLEILRRLDEAKVVCIKGRVVELDDHPGRYALRVDQMHRHPGKLESERDRHPKTRTRSKNRDKAAPQA